MAFQSIVNIHSRENSKTEEEIMPHDRGDDEAVGIFDSTQQPVCLQKSS
jgi:hypothetical protein